MKDYAYLNPDILVRVCAKLTTNECKVLLLVLCYLSSNNKSIYINNAETRGYISSMGYNRAPERISAILGSLVKKNVLKREAQGVFSVVENLYMPVSRKE